MVLWQSWIFWEKCIFGPKNGQNSSSLGLFQCMKTQLLNLLLICLIMKVYFDCCMLRKIWENFGSWDMCQNVLGQSDCRIFKSTISLEQNGEKVWFFACWYKFIEIKSWLKNIGMSMVINVCSHSGCRYLKLAVSQIVSNGINW